MLVRFPQSLVISEYFNYDQFGELVLALPLDGESRPFSPTSIEEPGAAANARMTANTLRRITLDDTLGGSNPSVLRHPNGSPFSLPNGFRGGDRVQNAVLPRWLGGRLHQRQAPLLAGLPAPVIGQLVPGDPDQPGDADLGLGSGPDRGQERLRGQVLGQRPLAAPGQQVAVQLRERLVVQLQQIAHTRTSSGRALLRRGAASISGRPAPASPAAALGSMATTVPAEMSQLTPASSRSVRDKIPGRRGGTHCTRTGRAA